MNNKTILSLLVGIMLISLPQMCPAQGRGNLNYTAFDTNGPKGECLFPEDEYGNAIMTGVVECPGFTKEQLNECVQKWLHITADKNEMSISDVFCCPSLVMFSAKVPIGTNILKLGFIYTLARYESEVSFSCSVEIKDGKFRYTLHKFWTDRRTIRGEGKSNGPSNLLHWQRVNSLTKEDKLDQVKREEETYNAEFATIQSIIEDLKNCTVEPDF